MSGFQGLSGDAYRFFWEIAFNNNRAFFEENRDRYKREVQQPMLALAEYLIPTAREIDPEFNLRPAAIVSRIRRDTRFSKDKSLYRDHVWLAFKRHGERTSESFVVYAEFERDGFGYGMGMYCPQPLMMQEMRARILARPSQFLEIAENPAFTERFTLSGELYKRPKIPDAPAELAPWVNRKRLSYGYFTPELKRTMTSEVADEIREGFELLKPMYRFLMGL